MVATEAFTNKINDAAEEYQRPPSDRATPSKPPRIGSLLQLTKLIDQELLSSSFSYQRKGESKTSSLQKRRPPLGLDSMCSLLDTNDQIQFPSDDVYAPGIQHVALVFAKPLINDRITLEYASRLRVLAKAIGAGASSSSASPSSGSSSSFPPFDDYKPTVIYFIGGITPGNFVSGASAGFLFFVNLCQSNGISLDGIDLRVEETEVNGWDSGSVRAFDFVDNGTIDSQNNNDAIRDSPNGVGVDADGDVDSDDVDVVECEVDDDEDVECDVNVDAQSSHHNKHQQNRKGEALSLVAKHICNEYLPGWLQASPILESATDEYGEKRIQPLKKVRVHFTLFSTEYHLCNLNDIHLRSPNQSPLKKTLESYLPRVAKQYHQGVVDTTWSFGYSIYPYLYSHQNRNHHLHLSSSGSGAASSTNMRSFSPIVTKDDRVRTFLGKYYLLGEGLKPLLVNLRGVVNNAEFFQQDNYLALVSIRRSLVSYMEDFYRERPSLKSSLRLYSISEQHTRKYDDSGSKSTPAIDIILEGALLSLGRCMDLVRPAGLLRGPVSGSEWKQALQLLEHTVIQLQQFCDPDRPLDPIEWTDLEC